MASIRGLAPIVRLLTLTNIAESFGENSYHVWRISFVATIILDDYADDDDNLFGSLSEEEQQLLNWQALPENLRNDVEVRNTLTQQSGSLCPFKNISTSLYDKVKSEDASLKGKIGNYPLSAFEQISFRSAMLTKHSARDGHPKLLAQHDGLGDDLNFLRWRSHEHITVDLSNPTQCFRVFWLFQWDIVGKLLVTGRSPDVDTDATNQGENPSPSPKLHQDFRNRRADRPKIFNGVRFKEKRKSQWVAQVKPKGAKNSLWLGSYSSEEEAARAADAGHHYFNKASRLNFQDSPQYLLKQIPAVYSAKEKEGFVKEEARRLAGLSKNFSSMWDPSNWYYCNTTREQSTAPQLWDNIHSDVSFGANITQLATNAAFDVSLGGVLPAMMTSEKNRGFQASASHGCGIGGEILQEIGRSLPSIPSGSFTPNSHGVGVLTPRPIEQAERYAQQAAISPAGNFSSEFDPTDAMNIWDQFSWGDLFLAPDTRSGISGYDSDDHGEETAHGLREGDWKGDSDYFFSATHG